MLILETTFTGPPAGIVQTATAPRGADTKKPGTWKPGLASRHGSRNHPNGKGEYTSVSRVVQAFCSAAILCFISKARYCRKAANVLSPL
ncbi:MAG: hypothetical protein LBI68_00305, partial [Azoarcus sp.]|nr:hypothetical protein [Azoarcus sp.]